MEKWHPSISEELHVIISTFLSGKMGISTLHIVQMTNPYLYVLRSTVGCNSSIVPLQPTVDFCAVKLRAMRETLAIVVYALARTNTGQLSEPMLGGN